MSKGQDHTNLQVVCPQPECWLHADVTRTWDMTAHSGQVRKEVLHAKVSCPRGHHFNMPFDALTIVPVNDRDLYGFMYGKDAE